MEAALSVHPHVRGVNVHGHVVEHDVFRFIPTCVGLMSSQAFIRLLAAVHPHVRGVNYCRPTPKASESVHPHVRGVNTCRK